MSPEFLHKWEHILEDVEKNRIPIEFVKKIVLKLEGKKQQTINIEKLLDQGLEPEQVEEAINNKLVEMDDFIITIEFVLNIRKIAEIVQPETDRILSNLK
jgi:hypothetical protein